MTQGGFHSIRMTAGLQNQGHWQRQTKTNKQKQKDQSKCWTMESSILMEVDKTMNGMMDSEKVRVQSIRK